MEDFDNGIIRKLIIGKGLKDGMAYVVGNDIKGGYISRIVEDMEYFRIAHVQRVQVVVTMDDGSTRIWKEFTGMPVAIEYDLNF